MNAQETKEALEYVVGLSKEQPKPEIVKSLESKPFAFVDKGKGLEVLDLEEYLPRPVRHVHNREFVDVDSFVDYYRKFENEETSVFGSILGRTVWAVFDYGKAETPGWGKHIAKLNLVKTPDYERWCNADGEKLSQSAFAEFIEDMSHTVVDPEAAAIIELAENLSITSNRSLDSKINRVTGAQQLGYVDDVTAGGGKTLIKVPDKLGICVQPYFASKPVDILVRLRIRINDGRPFFMPCLDRPWKFEEEMYRDIVKSIEDSLSVKVLLSP